jgi:hypothetical protein
MQKTLLIGYLGKDPEMKYTADGTAIATFTIASTDAGRTVPASRRNTLSGSISRPLANVPRSLRNTSIKAAGSSSKAGNGPNRGMTSSLAARST